MGWLRDHRRFGAWPGFAALALQIVLSFGHIHIGKLHVDGVWRSTHAALVKSDVAPDAKRGLESHPTALSQSQTKAPAHHSGQTPGDDEDYCAVCASIFLVSSSVAAQPPFLPVPLHFQRIALVFGTQNGLSASHSTYFQSRAPPSA